MIRTRPSERARSCTWRKAHWWTAKCLASERLERRPHEVLPVHFSQCDAEQAPVAFDDHGDLDVHDAHNLPVWLSGRDEGLGRRGGKIQPHGDHELERFYFA